MGVIHHLDVGCADASVIYTENFLHTFLVDCHNIGDYSYMLPWHSKTLHGVFITHQHQDHFSGLQYLRDNGFKINYLIYSPYFRRWDDNSVTYDEWTDFEDHVDYFKKQGTKLYSPYRQDNWQKPWWTVGDLKFYMLGPNWFIANSETRELHDASLVFTVMGQLGRCCFTGDASKANLEYIAKNTTNYCNGVLRASHHGSLTGISIDFIAKSKAHYTIMSTSPGKYENVPHPFAIRCYSELLGKPVYRTDELGSLRTAI